MKPKYTSLLKEENTITTNNNKTIHIWRLDTCTDEKILNELATCFRQHYCSDQELDILKSGYGYSREKFLNEIKFPNRSDRLGNSTRSGDFCEILVADFVQYILNYYMPRTRYDRKANPNSSTQGSDLLAFKVGKNISSNDELLVFEVKGQATNTKAKNRLQDAVNDSTKDVKIIAFSLNAINQRLIDKGDYGGAKIIQRFQNATDHPYKTELAAAAVHSDYSFSKDVLIATDTSKHVNPDLYLLVIHKENLMNFIHELYRRAAIC